MDKTRDPANEIHSHRRRGNLANECTVIVPRPKPEGDAMAGYCHRYDVFTTDGDDSVREPLATIDFQDGLPSAGINGVTNEVLITILVDRLARFQAGPHRCRENSLAITKLEEALHWLGHRTGARMARGVEGTMKP